MKLLERTENKRKHPSRGNAGFLLAEGVITMFVVGIVAAAIYAGITLSLATIRAARENLRATQIMVEKTEAIRLYAWSEINSNGLLPLSFSVPFDVNGNTNGLLYSG